MTGLFILKFQELWVRIFLIFCCILPYIAEAGSLYRECVYAWEFGDTIKTDYTLYPLSKSCIDTCEFECKGFNDTLNTDIYSDCLNACRSGQLFQSKIRIPAAAVPQEHSLKMFTLNDTALGTARACSTIATSEDSPEYNYQDTGILISPGSTRSTYIILRGGAEHPDNTVYGCGFKDVVIYPYYYSMDTTGWPNAALLTGSSKEIWNARNSSWTDTGVKFKNGDWLGITFGGDYYYNCSSTACTYEIYSDSLLMAPPSSTAPSASTVIELPGSKLQMGSKPEGCEGATDEAVIAECLIKISQIDFAAIDQYNRNITIIGLSGSAENEARPAGIPGPTLNSFKMASFKGIVKGYSDTWNKLQLKHYDTGVNTNWHNNIGGKKVFISWKGCKRTGGEGIQYAIVPGVEVSTGENSTPETVYTPSPSAAWRDVPSEALLNSKPLTIETDVAGKLYLRIKPLEYPGNGGAACTNANCTDIRNNYGAAKSTGQYNIQVNVPAATGSLSKFLSQILADVSMFLFGNETKVGAAQDVFVKITGGMIKTIRALLALYIAWTGMSFMLGLANITQKEGLIRLTKIGVVLTLISDSGWTFFNNYLFSLLIDGTLQIITLIFDDPSMGLDVKQELAAGNPYAVFSIMDKPLMQILGFKEIFDGSGFFGTGLLGGPVWKKIVGLIFSNILGFMLAIVVIIAIIIYLVVIFKAMMVYMVSLVGLAILMMTAPIFISFLLFAKTREMFDSWIKLLLSFCLQPILIFAMLSLMQKLLLIGLYMTLSFTVCKSCLFPISIGSLIENYCLIDIYRIVAVMHATGWLADPISSIAVAFYFLIVAISTYTFINLMSSLATQLVSGAYFGVNITEVAAEANPLTKIADMWETMTGTASQKSDFTGHGGKVERYRKRYVSKEMDKYERHGDVKEEVKEQVKDKLEESYSARDAAKKKIEKGKKDK